MTDWVRSMDRPLLNTATFLKAKGVVHALSAED